MHCEYDSYLQRQNIRIIHRSGSLEDVQGFKYLCIRVQEKQIFGSPPKYSETNHIWSEVDLSKHYIQVKI